jgi:hypothetical protein
MTIAPSQLEQHRVALTGHCYRMMGSAIDADDAVQETMVRAWRGLQRFDGRASLRTWLQRARRPPPRRRHALHAAVHALAARPRGDSRLAARARRGLPGFPALAGPGLRFPGVRQYRRSERGEGHDPWALIVLELSGDRIAGWNSFLDTGTMFPLFGLPPHLPA